MSAAANRIETIFREERAAGNAVLMPFITGGFPDLQTTREVLPALGRAGARIVEIGFPFSDPIADGPVIAASMHEALQHGVTPEDIFALCGEVSGSDDSCPALVAMASISLLRAAGEETFARRAKRAGFAGLIVPDADLEESAALRSICDEHDLCLSLLISPTTSIDRAKRIAEISSGFLYLLARAGITGETDRAPNIEQRVTDLRRITDLPIAAGFGISTADHVTAVTASADAAIVGSALVRRMHESRDDAVNTARAFIHSLAAGLRRGSLIAS